MKCGLPSGLIVLLAMLVSCQPQEPLPILGFPDVMADGTEVPHRIMGLDFITHHGQPIDTGLLMDDIWVMNTFFTSCPSICPKMTDQIATVQRQYTDDDVHFMSLSIDPERDRPDRLRRFMASHKIAEDENWSFMTGDKKTIYDFARYQLFLSAMVDTIPVEEDFIHSEKVVLIDTDRHIRGYYTGTDAADMHRLAKDIRRLKQEW